MELWGAGAVFSLTSYSDTNRNEVNLIKDWRDLFNQASLLTPYKFGVRTLSFDTDFSQIKSVHSNVIEPAFLSLSLKFPIAFIWSLS